MILTSNYEDLKTIVKNEKFPLVICDLEAFNYNLEKVGKHLRKSKKFMRLCTKSVRVPKLIKKVEEQDFVNGLFTYNSAEALFYAEQFKIRDILLGYPTTSEKEIEDLCKAASIKDVEITIMIDSTYHLDLLEKAAKENDVGFKILIEVDVADKLLGRNIGVYRSPLREPKDIVEIIDLASSVDCKKIINSLLDKWNN